MAILMVLCGVLAREGVAASREAFAAFLAWITWRVFLLRPHRDLPWTTHVDKDEHESSRKIKLLYVLLDWRKTYI